jgi:hypothetical protein
MNRNLKIVIGVVVAAVAAAAVWFFFLAPEPEAAKPVAKQEKRVKKAKRIADAKAPRMKAKKDRPKRERPKRDAAKAREAVSTTMTAAEQKLYDAMQDAWDDENFGALRALVDEAAKSANPEVRQQAVDALGWFGQDALPELTLFMADPDEDVLDAACDAWRAGVSQIEDNKLRGAAMLSAMQVVRSRDQLDFMVMEADTLPNSDQIRILETLIGGDNKAAADAAREHYEFVTGEEYEGPEAAQKWLQENPDDEDE